MRAGKRRSKARRAPSDQATSRGKNMRGGSLRAAKLLVEVESRYIGFNVGKRRKAGRKVNVQRSQTDPATFIIWFGKS